MTDPTTSKSAQTACIRRCGRVKWLTMAHTAKNTPRIPVPKRLQVFTWFDVGAHNPPSQHVWPKRANGRSWWAKKSGQKKEMPKESATLWAFACGWLCAHVKQMPNVFFGPASFCECVPMVKWREKLGRFYELTWCNDYLLHVCVYSQLE